MYELMATTLIRERSNAGSALPHAAVLPEPTARTRRRGLATLFSRTRTAPTARHAAR